MCVWCVCVNAHCTLTSTKSKKTPREIIKKIVFNNKNGKQEQNDAFEWNKRKQQRFYGDTHTHQRNIRENLCFVSVSVKLRLCNILLWVTSNFSTALFLLNEQFRMEKHTKY